MAAIETIHSIYDELRVAYAPVADEITKQLQTVKGGVERQKVMFPPRDTDSFDAAQAEAGFLKYDCAVLTAFRATRTYHGNICLNGKLKKEILELGYGLIPVDGCFREAQEREASHEDSFFVYAGSKVRKKVFFTHIYNLSEKYRQDSFLYKTAGMSRTAFLISTNEDSRAADGNIKLAGRLYLNLPPIGPYTDLGKNGQRIAFLVEKPDIVDESE